MNSFNNTSLESIINLNQVMNIQKEKLERIRTKVRELEFKNVDIVGNYQPVAFKAIDGGDDENLFRSIGNKYNRCL